MFSRLSGWIKVFLFLVGFLFQAHAASRWPELAQDTGFPAPYVGHYIFSNELSFGVLAKPLENQRGAAIIVGGLRAFDRFSMGQFERLIAIDIDPLVVDFNRWLIQQIPLYSRVEMIQKLLDVRLTEADQARLERGELCDTELERIIYNQMYNEKALFPDWVPAVLPRTNEGYTAYSAFFQHLRQHLLAGKWKDSFLSSPERYHRVQIAAQEGLIVTSLASIFGNKALAAIGQQLRSVKENVGLVDVSNALGYRNGLEEMKQWIRNFRALPMREDALLFHTNRVDRFDSSQFRYFSTSFSRLAKNQDDSFFKTLVEDYPSWNSRYVPSVSMMIHDDSASRRAASRSSPPCVRVLRMGNVTIEIHGLGM